MLPFTDTQHSYICWSYLTSRSKIRCLLHLCLDPPRCIYNMYSAQWQHDRSKYWFQFSSGFANPSKWFSLIKSRLSHSRSPLDTYCSINILTATCFVWITTCDVWLGPHQRQLLWTSYDVNRVACRPNALCGRRAIGLMYGGGKTEIQ